MSEINCPHCQTSNPSGTRYCSTCGAALPGGTGPLGPGQVMNGRYTILRPLSKGGMGALYLASETIANQERLVVIKEMLDYYEASDPQGETKALKRFETEAATLARLSTVGIPQVFDFFRAAGRNYIVMQYIQGENLEKGLSHVDEDGNLVPGAPYSVEQVRRWGVQLCKVLESLSVQDVIHMDIKPANLIVSEMGDIWLVDFGTARARHGSNPGGPVGLEQSSVYGTQGYAPPEQVAGNAEPRSDVYALAATLYHLLTDDDPRDSPFSFPRMDQLPREMRTALRAALAFDVTQRPTARQFATLLEAELSPVTGSTFRWQDGSVASQPRDLTVTANKKWEEARGYFISEEWARWFKELHRHDLVAQMQQVKSQQKDPDLALDAFLRILDPSLDPPGIHLPVPVLDAGVVPWQKQTTLELEIFNLGGGALQGRFVDLPEGVKVKPEAFVTHEWQRAKITVDTSDLSPSARQQTLFLGIDAGVGGKKYLPITISVPEPKLRLDRSQVDLGVVGRGEPALSTVKVSNSGGSTLLAEVTTQSGWLQVEPARFLCLPGKSYPLKLTASARHLKAGENNARINVHAKAGNWTQSTQLPVRLVVRQENGKLGIPQVESRVSTSTDWTPSLGGAIILGFYGFILGGFLGYLTQGTFGGISTMWGGMLAGAIIGMFVSLLPGAIIGAAGRLNRQAGRPGLRAGLRTGVALGMLTGAAVGGLLEVLISWLGFALAAGEGLNVLGALTGAAVGLAMAALLGLRGG